MAPLPHNHSMMKLTHFKGPPVLVNPAQVVAILPAQVARDMGDTVDKAAKTIVLVTGGVSYYVKEPVPEVEAEWKDSIFAISQLMEGKG